MSSFQKHCQDCVEKLGEPFEEVHIWLDELFAFVGSDHRDIRHNNKGIEKIVKMFGEKAGLAAEIHIKEDNDGVIPLVDDEFLKRIEKKSHIQQAFCLEYY